ncbi:unnamed protein product [Penicillium bialowiezense]
MSEPRFRSAFESTGIDLATGGPGFKDISNDIEYAELQGPRDLEDDRIPSQVPGFHKMPGLLHA